MHKLQVYVSWSVFTVFELKRVKRDLKHWCSLRNISWDERTSPPRIRQKLKTRSKGTNIMQIVLPVSGFQVQDTIVLHWCLTREHRGKKTNHYYCIQKLYMTSGSVSYVFPLLFYAFCFYWKPFLKSKTPRGNSKVSNVHPSKCF